MNRKFLADAGERIAASAAVAGLSVAITELRDLSYTWMPFLITALTVLKVTVAKYVGDPDSAGLK